MLSIVARVCRSARSAGSECASPRRDRRRLPEPSRTAQQPMETTEPALPPQQMHIRHIPHTGKSLQAEAAVDSPLAVVRELIDNSIDAGANFITVCIDAQTGGLHHVSVRDDGCGVHSEDYRLVFAQASTSKQNTECLGFRGEALHLITRIAKGCRITTKTATDTTAAQWDVPPPDLDNAGGSTHQPPKAVSLPPHVKRVAAPKGTTIVFKDLFHNTPVRKKLLLKKPAAAASVNSIEALLKCYAVIHAPARFTLKLIARCNGYTEGQSSTRFSTPAHTNAQTLLQQWSSSAKLTTYTFPPRNAASEITIAVPTFGTLSGALNPDHFQPIVTVNKRLLSTTRGTGKAFKRSFHTVFAELFPDYKTPGNVPWMLAIRCPESLIDSNIEPKKDDVLLEDHDAIMASFKFHLEEALSISTPKHTTSQFPTAVISHRQGSDERSIPEIQLTEADTNIRNAARPTAQMSPQEKESHWTGSLPSPQSERSTDQSWSRTMHDRLSSEPNSQDLCEEVSLGINRSTDTSTTSLSEDSTDEDLRLARDITISNPFTLMKMRSCCSFAKAKKPVNEHGNCIPTSRLGTNAHTTSPHKDQLYAAPMKNTTVMKRMWEEGSTPLNKKQKVHTSPHTTSHKSVNLKISLKFKQSTLPLRKPLPSEICLPSKIHDLSHTQIQSCLVEWKADCSMYDDDAQEDTIDSVVKWIDKTHGPIGSPVIQELEGWLLATYD